MLQSSKLLNCDSPGKFSQFSQANLKQEKVLSESTPFELLTYDTYELLLSANINQVRKWITQHIIQQRKGLMEDKLYRRLCQCLLYNHNLV